MFCFWTARRQRQVVPAVSLLEVPPRYLPQQHTWNTEHIKDATYVVPLRAPFPPRAQGVQFRDLRTDIQAVARERRQRGLTTGPHLPWEV